MTCGIYKLEFANTDRVYIGQSVNIEVRYSNHLKSFTVRNASKKLLDAYDTYGAPKLNILLECDRVELNDLENSAIQVYNSFHNGFNSQEFAEDVPVLFGENHPGAKYSNAQIEKAFLLLCEGIYTHQQIADMTSISKNMVNHIAIGTCHSWLEGIYSEQYKKLIKSKPASGNSRDRGKIYPQIISPEGIKYTIDNLRAFSREHNLPYSSLNGLVNGRTKNVRGWMLDSITI